MKLAWATDIHLDCVEDSLEAAEELSKSFFFSDAVILSGDISISPMLIDHLKLLEVAIQKPIYFVLGNHDYYFSGILETRKRVTDACRESSYLRYLNSVPFVRLDKKTVLIGADGWYDAYNGDAQTSEIIMNDWLKIKDFHPALSTNMLGKSINKSTIVQIAREICKASISHVIRGIKSVSESADSIIVVTHVPPFVESYADTKYKNAPVEHIVPWYTSRLMGEMLKTAAKTYPQIQFTVLSGHTHGFFEGKLLPNLTVKVGKSEYGSPQMSGNINT